MLSRHGNRPQGSGLFRQDEGLRQPSIHHGRGTLHLRRFTRCFYSQTPPGPPGYVLVDPNRPEQHTARIPGMSTQPPRPDDLGEPEPDRRTPVYLFDLATKSIAVAAALLPLLGFCVRFAAYRLASIPNEFAASASIPELAATGFDAMLTVLPFLAGTFFISSKAAPGLYLATKAVSRLKPTESDHIGARIETFGPRLAAAKSAVALTQSRIEDLTARTDAAQERGASDEEFEALTQEALDLDPEIAELKAQVDADFADVASVTEELDRNIAVIDEVKTELEAAAKSLPRWLRPSRHTLRRRRIQTALMLVPGLVLVVGARFEVALLLTSSLLLAYALLRTASRSGHVGFDNTWPVLVAFLLAGALAYGVSWTGPSPVLMASGNDGAQELYVPLGFSEERAFLLRCTDRAVIGTPASELGELRYPRAAREPRGDSLWSVLIDRRPLEVGLAPRCPKGN